MDSILRMHDEVIARVKKFSTSNPNVRSRIAYHEAGRVVMALYEHAGVDSRTDELSDIDYTEKMQKAARIAMAGLIADQISRFARPVMPAYRHVDMKSIENALFVYVKIARIGTVHPLDTQFLNPLHFDEDTRCAWVRLQWLIVRDMLRVKWTEVEAVAHALLANEVLSREKVLELLRPIWRLPA